MEKSKRKRSSQLAYGLFVGDNGLLERILVFVGAAQLAVVTFYFLPEGEKVT